MIKFMTDGVLLKEVEKVRDHVMGWVGAGSHASDTRRVSSRGRPLTSRGLLLKQPATLNPPPWPCLPEQWAAAWLSCQGWPGNKLAAMQGVYVKCQLLVELPLDRHSQIAHITYLSGAAMLSECTWFRVPHSSLENV